MTAARSRSVPRPRSSLVAAAGTIAAITLVARVVGFGRWFVFSGSVGATSVGTTYQSVNAVPNVLFEIAAGGVLAAIAVPLVADALARDDRAGADATASALLSWALLVLVPAGVAVALAAAPIASTLLAGAGPGAVVLGTDMLRVFAVQVPLYGVAIVLAGVLQAHRRFVAAALAPLLSSVVVIATYLAYRAAVDRPASPISEIPTSATTLLAVGTTLGVVALSVPLVLPIRRARISLRPTLTFPAGVGRRVRTLALAGLLGVVGQQLATLVVIRVANDRGQPGTLNVFTYTQAITLLPYAVLAVPIATAAFPALAGAEARSDVAAGAAGTLRRVWAATLAVGLLGTAVLVAVAAPVGRFFSVFDAGSGSASTVGTIVAMGDAVTLMAPTVLALAVTGLLSRACYVRGRAALAGATLGLAWLATTVLPLVALDANGSDGPRTLRLLSLGSSIGLLAGAGVLVVIVARSWGASALAIPPRTVLAVVVGPAAGAVVGRLLSATLLERSALGQGAIGPLLVGLLAATVAGGIATGTALALDPSVRSLVARRWSSPVRVGSGGSA